jgi:hypothetical protein
MMPGVYTPGAEYTQRREGLIADVFPKWDAFYQEKDNDIARSIIASALEAGELTMAEADSLWNEREDYQIALMEYMGLERLYGESAAPLIGENLLGEEPAVPTYMPAGRERMLGVRDVLPQGKWIKGKYYPAILDQKRGASPYGPRPVATPVKKAQITGNEELEYREYLRRQNLSPNEVVWMENQYSDLWGAWLETDQTVPFIQWISTRQGGKEGGKKGETAGVDLTMIDRLRRLYSSLPQNIQGRLNTGRFAPYTRYLNTY